MDVAQLGLEVQSTQVKAATNDLNKLSNAAKVADAAADGLSASTRNAGAAAAQAAGGFQKATAAAKAHAAAVNDNLTKANVTVNRMGGSMSGLAAQFQDIGVTAAMGMNPVMIALQQGTQIAGQMEMAMQSGAKASAVFATAFRSLLSPVSLASIALTAFAAAGLQMVNWTKLAADAVRGMANVLVTVAPYAATAAAGPALL